MKNYKPLNHNPYSGYHAPGYRFRLNCRPISRTPLYLPIALKSNPKIVALKKGISPLEVFGVSNIRDAREAFHHLRQQHDFTFWAARNFFVRDINDPDRVVPLFLSGKLAKIIDFIQRRYHRGCKSRYVITKKTGRIGLTTSMQAYMLWLQINSEFKGNAYICGPSSFNLLPLKYNLAHYLGHSNLPSSKKICFYHPDFHCPRMSVLFNSMKNPDAPRGIDFNYSLFADMSKWKDSDGKKSIRAYVAGISGILLDPRTLIILEGNRPADLPVHHIELQNYYARLKASPSPIPIILDEAIYSTLNPTTSYWFHICL